MGKKRTRWKSRRRKLRDVCVARSGGWPLGCPIKKRVGVTRPAVALTLSSLLKKTVIHPMRILSLALQDRGVPQPLRAQRQDPKVTPGPNMEATLSTQAFQQHLQVLQAVRVREARKCPVTVRRQKEEKQLV